MALELTAWWASESPLLIVLDGGDHGATVGIAVAGLDSRLEQYSLVLIGPTYRQQEASAIDEQAGECSSAGILSSASALQ